MTLFRAGTERVVDESPAAKLRIDSIRRRPGNESVDTIYRDNVFAEPMDAVVTDTTNAIVMNVDAPILVRVNDLSRARHAASFLTLEAVATSEVELAEEEGMEPESVCAFMRLGGAFDGVMLKSGGETPRVARQAGSFNGMIRVLIGTAEAAAAAAAEMAAAEKGGGAGEYRAILPIVGNDTVRLRVKDGDEVIAERTVSFADDATLDLMDSTFSAERTSVHCGERFYVRVRDADCDTTDEADKVEVSVKGSGMGVARKIELVETMPHSGVFTGVSVTVPPAAR